jgi:hypothetical protein
MPISAIETGCVDAVLRPNEIAHELIRRSRIATPAATDVARRAALIDDNPRILGRDGVAHRAAREKESPCVSN